MDAVWSDTVRSASVIGQLDLYPVLVVLLSIPVMASGSRWSFI